MPSAAGYAAVIALGQSTMRSLVRVLYITNKIKHVLPLNVPLPLGLGALTGRFRWFRSATTGPWWSSSAV